MKKLIDRLSLVKQYYQILKNTSRNFFFKLTKLMMKIILSSNKSFCIFKLQN